MHGLRLRALGIATLTALAIACGGNDNNNNNGDSDTIQVTAATQAQAAEAFPLFAEAVQAAFVAGQANQTPAATGFSFSVPSTNCDLYGTYTIAGTGVLADSANPSAGSTDQFTTSFVDCTRQTFAIDGDLAETVTISQTTASGTTTTDEVIHATSSRFGFAILVNLRPSEEFSCGATDLSLHVTVTQPSGGAATQTVSGTGTWCSFTWDDSFVGSYTFPPNG